jgi:dolichyl-phosphate-mannose-protein mannosyltransferase
MISPALDDSRSTYALAWSPRVCLALWITGLVVVAFLCASWLDQQLERFADVFPQSWAFLLVLLAGLAIPLPILYRTARSRGLWVYEPALILGLLVSIPLFYAPVATLTVGWMLVACYGTGRFCRERIGCSVASPVADIVFSSAIGLQLLVVALIVTGLAGGYTTWVFVLLIAIPTVIFHRQCAGLWAATGEIHKRWREQEAADSSSLVASLVFGFSLCLVACGLVVVLTPSTWPDPVQLHLPLARFYAESGALQAMPSVSYGYHPQAFEILMAMAYSMAGQSAAQMVHPMLFGLALLAVYGIGRELGIGRMGAMVGTAFAAAIPGLHWTGINIKNDLGLALFLLAAFWTFTRWLSTRNFRWIYLGVYFTGTAWLFKHPAALGIPALAVLFIYAAWQQQRRLKAFVACFVLFVCCSSFWLARAYLEHGDPFYPTNPTTPFPQNKWRSNKTAWEKASDRSTRLWALHYHYRGYYQASEDASLGLVLIITLPLWLLVRRRGAKSLTVALVVYLAAYYLFWVSWPASVRFFYGPLALLTMLSTSRLEYWYRIGGRLARVTLFGAASLALFFSMTVILVNEINITQLELLAGRINREEYLRRVSYGYETLEALERESDETDTVIAVALFSRAYAPYPQNYYFRELSDQCLPQDLLARVQPSFIIAPARPEYDLQVEAAVPEAVEIHSTELFRLYRVGRE